MQEGPLRPYCGDSMDRYVQRIRYPPFELEHMNPKNIPISQATIEKGMSVTNFTIGTEDDWFVEWKDAEEGDIDLLELDCEILVATQILDFD